LKSPTGYGLARRPGVEFINSAERHQRSAMGWQRAVNCGPRGDRTHNPRIKSPLLCQLS
jgi:hypothetical protein